MLKSLFIYEAYEVKISPEALMLKPFKKLYDRDKSKSKENAMMELAFCYFYADPRSPYMDYIDENERLEIIKESEGLPEKWKIDKDVQAAIDFYKSFTPISSGLLEDMKVAVMKLRDYLKTINLKATDDNGKPLLTLQSVVSALKQVPELVKSINDAEKSIREEMKQSARMRGSQEKSIMDEGLDD